MSDIKLYAWQPKGHGELSFFVCASSKQNAFLAVNAKIEKMLKSDEIGEFEINGWGTDYYDLTELPQMQVAVNYND